MPAEVNSVARTGGHEVRGRRATCDFSLILYPRVCLITYIQWNNYRTAGAFCAREALPEIHTLEIIFPSAMRQILLKSADARSISRSGRHHSPARRTHQWPSRRCPAPLPVTRLMRRWRNTRRRRHTWLQIRTRLERHKAACERPGRVGGGGAEGERRTDARFSCLIRLTLCRIPCPLCCGVKALQLHHATRL